MVLLDSDQTLPVTFNAPFASGVVLDSRRVLREGVAPLRDALAAAARQRGGGWSCPIRTVAENGLSFSVASYAGTPVLSPFFLERALGDSALEGTGYRTVEHRDADGVRIVLSLRRIVIRFNDFGAASVCVEADAAADAPLSAGAYRAAVEEAGEALAERLQPLLRESTEEAGRMLPAEWHLRPLAPAGTTSRPCTLPWLHRVYHLPVPAGAAGPTPEQARALIRRYSLTPAADASLEEGVLLLPGVGGSAALYPAGPCGRAAAARLEACIECQNVSWFAANRLNRELLASISLVGTRRERPALAELERDAETIIDLHERLALFRGIRLDQLANLPPQERVLTSVIGDAWNLPELMDGIQEKMSMLTEMHARVVAQLSERLNRRLNAFVFFFTVIGAAGLGIATFDFVHASAPGPVDRYRSLAIMLIFATLLAVAALSYTWRDGVRSASSARRGRRARSPGEQPRPASPAERPRVGRAATAASRASVS